MVRKNKAVIKKKDFQTHLVENPAEVYVERKAMENCSRKKVRQSERSKEESEQKRVERDVERDRERERERDAAESSEERERGTRERK